MSETSETYGPVGSGTPSMAARLAAVNVAMIRGSFGARTPDWRFVTGVAEEAGEFVGAYNRFSGTSRRTGTKEEMAKELADVVLTAYMAADVLGIDLDHMVAIKAEIMRNRGWRDAR